MLLGGKLFDLLLPSDHGLKVALVVVNMPLDGMVDKFMDLSNIGQCGICVILVPLLCMDDSQFCFWKVKVSYSYSHISSATVKAFTDGGASQVCRIFGKERYILCTYLTSYIT